MIWVWANCFDGFFHFEFLRPNSKRSVLFLFCTPVVEIFFQSEDRSLIGDVEFPRAEEVENCVEGAGVAVKEVPATNY